MTESADMIYPGVLKDGTADYRTAQQSWGIDNCWFISSIVGLAYRRPDAIPKLLEPLDEGGFTVRFPNQKPVKVAPNPEGAVNNVDGERRPDGFTNALETAANALGWGANTWRALTMGRGIKCLTGNGASFSTNLFFGFGNLFRSFQYKLEAAEAEGKIIVIGTGVKRIRISGLAGRHCYSLLSYDPKERVALIRDPYGEGTEIPADRAVPEKGPAVFWLTLDEVNQNFMGMVIER